MRTLPISIVALSSCAGFALSVAAQGTSPPIERMDQAPAKVLPRLTSPPAESWTEGIGGVQVSINAQGQNVIGDAANEPSIAVDPTAPNRICIGWRQFDSVNSNFRQQGFAYSVDGGRTWSARTLNPGTFFTDPVLRFTPDGVLLYSALNVNTVGGNDVYTVYTFRSLDAGKTFQPAVFSYGGDKQWLAIDRTNGIGHGNVYQAWNTAGNSYAPNTFNRSLTSGQTWSSPQTIPSRPVFGQLAVNSVGDLFVAGVPNSGFTSTFYVVRSTDAKNPATTPTFQPSVTVNLNGTFVIGDSPGPNPAGLHGMVQLVVDTSGGPRNNWLYLLSTVRTSDNDPADIHLSRSTDNGATWSTPVQVNDVRTKYQWMATLSVAPNGRLDVVWLDSRDAPASGAVYTSELYYSSSADGGTTWAPSQVQSLPFNPNAGWPSQQKMGDYFDMESDLLGAHLAYCSTVNGGQDVYYLRIGPRDCNGNGVDDAFEIASGQANDCNRNGIPDSCELAAGTLVDLDNDGLFDSCELACPADRTGDGTVDLADFFAFFNAWDATAILADINHDSIVDLEDFFAFLNSFDQGCP